MCVCVCSWRLAAVVFRHLVGGGGVKVQTRVHLRLRGLGGLGFRARSPVVERV